MYMILLTFLLVSAIAAPTLASDDDESFVVIIDGFERAYTIKSTAETVDSFITKHGPNLKISPNGPKLELGKTWADYQAKAGSAMFIKKLK